MKWEERELGHGLSNYTYRALWPHFALSLWKEEHSGRWGRKDLSSENCVGTSSKRERYMGRTLFPCFLDHPKWMNKHFTASSGNLCPLHTAEHECMIAMFAQDLSGVGRRAQAGSNKKQKLQLHLDIQLLWALEALEYFPEGEHLGPPRPGRLPCTFASCWNTGQSSRQHEHTDPISKVWAGEDGWGWASHEVGHLPEPMRRHFSCFLLRWFSWECCSSNRSNPNFWVPVAGSGWFV